MDTRKIVHFSPGGHITNNGYAPLLTVYFDDNDIVNYIASLKFWRATPDEIATIFNTLHATPTVGTVDRIARWIIEKLEMQPEGNSIVA